MCYTLDGTERLSILTELVDSPIIEEFNNAVSNISRKKHKVQQGHHTRTHINTFVSALKSRSGTISLRDATVLIFYKNKET